MLSRSDMNFVRQACVNVHSCFANGPVVRSYRLFTKPFDGTFEWKIQQMLHELCATWPQEIFVFYTKIYLFSQPDFEHAHRTHKKNTNKHTHMIGCIQSQICEWVFEVLSRMVTEILELFSLIQIFRNCVNFLCSRKTHAPPFSEFTSHTHLCAVAVSIIIRSQEREKWMPRNVADMSAVLFWCLDTTHVIHSNQINNPIYIVDLLQYRYMLFWRQRNKNNEISKIMGNELYVEKVFWKSLKWKLFSFPRVQKKQTLLSHFSGERRDNWILFSNSIWIFIAIPWACAKSMKFINSVLKISPHQFKWV